LLVALVLTWRPLSTPIVPWRPLPGVAVARWPLTALVVSSSAPSLLTTLLVTALARTRLALVLALLASAGGLPPGLAWRRAVLLPRPSAPFGYLLLSQLILRRSHATISGALLSSTPPSTILRCRVRWARIPVRPRIAGFWPRG
jgi:hypothetical protein